MSVADDLRSIAALWDVNPNMPAPILSVSLSFGKEPERSAAIAGFVADGAVEVGSDFGDTAKLKRQHGDVKLWATVKRSDVEVAPDPAPAPTFLTPGQIKQRASFVQEPLAETFDRSGDAA